MKSNFHQIYQIDRADLIFHFDIVIFENETWLKSNIDYLCMIYNVNKV